VQLHSTTLLLGNEWCLPLTSPGSEALIAFFVSVLETQVCWRSWPKEHNDPVLQGAGLREWSVTIFGKKFVRVEILSRGLSTGYEPKMISP